MTEVQLHEPTVKHMLYWMLERQRIYNKRRQGLEKPWTDDVVMQHNFFTNCYREQDKTTQWFKYWVREPLRNDPAVAMATFIFRRFNYIPTGKLLFANELLWDWDSRRCIELLSKRAQQGGKIFTGAFMMSSPAGKDKLPEICRMIDAVWLRKDKLVHDLEECSTLQEAWKLFQSEHHKGLLPYEVITDLRHTYLLEDATDKMTWAYWGPGGQRGANRLLGNEINTDHRRLSGKVVQKQPATSLSQDVCQRVGAKMLEIANSVLHRAGDLGVWEYPDFQGCPRFEMREIEHSACETDKYLRVCKAQGRSKRKYDGIGGV